MELSARGDGSVVVTLLGELNVADGASVSAALAAIASSGCSLMLDLEDLEFIDSSGLAAFARARRHARHGGFDVLLAGPRPQVLRMLTLTRMSDVFSVHLSKTRQALPGAPSLHCPDLVPVGVNYVVAVPFSDISSVEHADLLSPHAPAHGSPVRGMARRGVSAYAPGLG